MWGLQSLFVTKACLKGRISIVFLFYFHPKLIYKKTFSVSYCTIISFIILGRFHENLFTFFFLAGVKKKNKLLWNFLMKSRYLLPIAIQWCLVLNLPQNKFDKNNLKTKKNHNKFSSQIFVGMSQSDVWNYRTKGTWTSLKSSIFFKIEDLKYWNC